MCYGNLFYLLCQEEVDYEQKEPVKHLLRTILFLAIVHGFFLICRDSSPVRNSQEAVQEEKSLVNLVLTKESFSASSINGSMRNDREWHMSGHETLLKGSKPSHAFLRTVYTSF